MLLLVLIFFLSVLACDDDLDISEAYSQIFCRLSIVICQMFFSGLDLELGCWGERPWRYNVIFIMNQERSGPAFKALRLGGSQLPGKPSPEHLMPASVRLCPHWILSLPQI